MVDREIFYSKADKIVEKCGARRINAIIAMGIVVAVLLTVAFITVPLMYFAAIDMEKEGVATTDNALNGLNIILNDYQTEAKIYAIAITLNSDIKQYVINRNRAGINELLQPLLKQSELDAITITDDQGIVICRVHAPTINGDSIVNQANVQNALKGISSTTIERGTLVKLGVRAGVPIKDNLGQVIGVVSTGYSLDKNKIVDRIKDTFKTDSTLFIGDTRVATTIVEDGQRAIGTKLDKKVADIVLIQGLKYIGRATILGTKYITSYQPIIGPQGKPEGIMFAGQNLAVYESARNRMLITAGSVATVAVIMSIGIALKIGKRISQPLIQSVKLLHESEEQFRQMFYKQQAIMWLVDPATLRIIDANEAAQTFFGYSLEEIKKHRAIDLFIIPEESIKETHNNLRDCNSYLLETEVQLSTGKIRQVEIRKTLISLGSQEFFFDIITDITDRKKAEEDLRYLGTHDALTNLYNRSCFEEILHNKDLSHNGANAIIVCDLDGLKIANDTFGHEYGDQMLIKMANILAGCFGEGDVVSRIGGDEFAILLNNANSQVVKDYCKIILFDVDDCNKNISPIPISLSIGYACSTANLVSLKELYIEADNNMYREKLHRSQSARSAIVKTVMKLLEERDFITEGHAERLQDIVSCLGIAIGLSAHQIADLRLLGQFHDIGKVGVSDKVLLKPGKLTTEETIEMRRHCEIGNRIAHSSNELAPIADWILKHHEWWDGSGYPLGLAGYDIPLECRILAIADAYDAMTSDRPYRKAISCDDAITELIRFAGTQFDPEIVETFCNIKLRNNKSLK